MAGIEYEYNLGRAPYDVRIDSERYEQLLLEKANPRYPVKDLKIIIGRSGFLFDAVLVGRKKYICLPERNGKSIQGGRPLKEKMNWRQNYFMRQNMLWIYKILSRWLQDLFIGLGLHNSYI